MVYQCENICRRLLGEQHHQISHCVGGSRHVAICVGDHVTHREDSVSVVLYRRAPVPLTAVRLRAARGKGESSMRSGKVSLEHWGIRAVVPSSCSDEAAQSPGETGRTSRLVAFTSILCPQTSPGRLPSNKRSVRRISIFHLIESSTSHPNAPLFSLASTLFHVRLTR